jgi:DNA-binding response OmpR family regulator
MSFRRVPLIVIASVSAALADSVAQQLRREGNVVYITRSADGCLRVATSVGPDVVLLDPSLPGPRRLERLLKAHPKSASARVLHLCEGMPRPGFVLQRAPVAAGPHAA